MCDVCRRMEAQPRVVGYQGTDGAYSQIAAEHYFAAQAQPFITRGYDSFALLLGAVCRGEIAYAIQPIENTTAGSINEAYDLLARLDLHVVGEEILQVQHCLVGLPGSAIARLKRVYSHPQALAQCSEFLAGLDGCSVVAFTDTAMAVTKVRDERDPVQAAVASERAATLYGLEILARGINDQEPNYTRFVVVANAPAQYPAAVRCKTSLIFTTHHERGALVRCLNVLADHDLNLTKIESRPRPNTPWEYVFYVDFEGNQSDPAVRDALARVQQHTVSFKNLGSYPIRTRPVGR